MKKGLAIVFGFLMLSCGGEDDGPPPSPEGALLIFPDQNSECTTGIDVSATLSQVTFQWQAANNTDQYTLTVINLETNAPQSIITTSTSAALSIEKGAPFSWSVLSANAGSSETATSESWLFYNAGSQTTYAPFPAQIISPVSGSTVQANSEGQVQLAWSGADVENDIESYSVFLSTTTPPETLLITVDSLTQEALVDVVAGTTYYWRVVTTDAEGNTSDSGIFDFRVL